jgi:hypothetical protein
MLMAILIILLSNPGEPTVFGVMGEFERAADCMRAIRDADVPDEVKRKLACIEVKKQKSA